MKRKINKLLSKIINWYIWNIQFSKRKTPKALYFMLPWMIALAVIDMITAVMIGNNLHTFELNPLFLFFKSMIPLILLNICFWFLFYFVYKYIKGSGTRFFLVNFFVYMSLVRVGAIISNIKMLMYPPTEVQIEIAKATLTTAVKTNLYFSSILVFVLPFALSFITWCIWQIDYKITEK